MSIDLSILKKIRCRFLDRSTGMPVPGVIASLSVGVGDAPKSAQFPVATLCTDATGYMSFDLKPFIDLGLFTASGLFISAPKFGLTNYHLLGSLVAGPDDGAEKKDTNVSGSGKSYIGMETNPYVAIPIGEKKEPPCIVFPIYLENRLRDEHASESPCEPTRLPSIQSPDVCDYKVSPFSFVTPTALKLGNDCCEILLPSSTPIQQYRFYKVIIRRDDTGAPGVAIDDTPLTNRVTVVGALKSQATIIKFGEILEYRQDWYSLGHSLGEIKYSLPLAPGESTQLAVIEWSRDDLASRTDKTRATEFLDHDSRRDRAIEETVEAALREEQGGNSHMGSTSGTASGSTYGTGMWTGNHAFGGGISYSYGNKYLEADSLHDLHDRVRQTSSSIRSLNSTVIVQGTQTETNALQTRRVANHNHCHAMTIQYYEVLRHYRMSTNFSGRRKAILVPFEPFAFTSWELALRFRTVLEQTLLDPSLRNCFEALIRLRVAPPSVYDASQPIKPVVLAPPKITKRYAAVEMDGSQETVDSGVKVLLGDKVKISATGLLAFYNAHGYGARGFPPEGDGNEAPVGGHYPFIAAGLPTFSLVYKIGATGAWRQGGKNFEVTAKTEEEVGNIIFGVNNYTAHFRASPPGKVWKVDLEYPSHETEPTPIDPSKDDAVNSKAYRKSDDELCEARLLRHLQDNQGFYNGAVWLLMDVVERRLYLEQALHDRLDILDAIDDRPIALSGNYVAFQYSGPLAQWSDCRADDPKVPIEHIVTLPTRGLFAEAQMGHCNSCEKRDVTRMWDWTEMTAETPPEITGISPGPKGVAPSIAQGQLPGNVIQITQPQAAPDPTGLANALNVLKTPDIFRDMAGLDEVSKLLGELAKASSDANTKAMATQAQVEIEKIKARAKSGAGEGNNNTGTAAPSGVSAADAADRFSLLPEIKTFAKDVGLTDEEYKQFALDQIYGTRATGESSGGNFISAIRKLIGGSLQSGITGKGVPEADATIADAAETWGQDKLAMDAYVAFDDKKRVWFFSPNKELAGAVSRPPAFADWKDWDLMRWQSQQVLADLAGLKRQGLQRTADTLLKLKAAYGSWFSQQLAVFWGGGTRTSACNIFVGDSLAIRGINTASAGGKYYSVGEITKGLGPFREIPLAEATRGDIVCFGSFHVEIISSVSTDRKAFCSIGVVRDPTGKEKCGKADDNDDPRRLANPSLRFFRPSGL